MENMSNNEHLTQHQIRNTGNVSLAGEISHDSGRSRKMHFYLQFYHGLYWCLQDGVITILMQSTFGKLKFLCVWSIGN